VLENWDKVYANTTLYSSLKLTSNRSSFVSNSRGAAALLILSLVVSFVNLGMTLADHAQHFNFFWVWTLALTFLDVVFFWVCFGLTTNVMQYNDFNLGIDLGATIFSIWGPLGPAFPVLATGIFLKIGAVPILGPLLFVLLGIGLAAFVWVMKCIMKSDPPRRILGE